MTNKIVAVMGLFCVLSCFCSAESSTSVMPPEYISSIGGSNYAFYDISAAYIERDEPNSWWEPGAFRHAVGTFHLQRSDEIFKILSSMYKGGQRKIALVIWHTNITDGKWPKNLPSTAKIPAGLEDICGHTINSAGGQMSLQHQKNLAEFVGLIKKVGFESLTVRFAPQGFNDPMHWKSWEEKYYIENTDFIFSAKKIVDEVLSGSHTAVFYDLGLEEGGIEVGFSGDYTQRLWKQYTDKFGTKDTIGFSFAVSPGRVTRMLDIYEKVGCYPSVYPLDIYFDADKALGYVAKEFRSKGISNPAIIIQETFYNDAKTLSEIQAAAKEHNLTILYIVQWPCERSKMYWENTEGSRRMRHFSVVHPIDYNNYLKSL